MNSSIQESLLDAIKERIVSPISGIFIVMWVLTNWRFLLVLMFDVQPIQERISYVLDVHGDLWTVLILPVLLTIAYVVFHPFLAVVAFGISSRADVYRRQIQYRHENERPFNTEEKRAIGAELEALREDRSRLGVQLFEMQARYLDVMSQTQKNLVETQEKLEVLAKASTDNNLQSALDAINRSINETKKRIDRVGKEPLRNKYRFVSGPNADAIVEESDRVSDVYLTLARKNGFLNALDQLVGKPVEALSKDERHLLTEAEAWKLVEERSGGIDISEFGRKVFALRSIIEARSPDLGLVEEK